MAFKTWSGHWTSRHVAGFSRGILIHSLSFASILVGSLLVRGILVCNKLFKSKREKKRERREEEETPLGLFA